MPSLYHLDAELAALSALLAESGGAADDETLAHYDALLDARDDKLDSYMAVILNFDAECEAYAEEADRFQALAKTAGNASKRLRQRLLDSMLRANEKKLSGRLGKASVQTRTSKAVVLLADPADLPEQFQRVRIDADRVALKQALAEQDEDAVRVAEIETRTSVHIRLT